jgi:hypothetical protein
MSHASGETLATPCPKLHAQEVNGLQFFMICLVGWITRSQQHVIEYLQARQHPNHATTTRYFAGRAIS